MARLPPRKTSREPRDGSSERDGGDPRDAAPAADLEGELNTSLMDMLDLLGREVARLQEALEFYRMSEVADKDAIIRWHVQQIDARHDRMAEVKSMILASDDDKLH